MSRLMESFWIDFLVFIWTVQFIMIIVYESADHLNGCFEFLKFKIYWISLFGRRKRSIWMGIKKVSFFLKNHFSAIRIKTNKSDSWSDDLKGRFYHFSMINWSYQWKILKLGHYLIHDFKQDFILSILIWSNLTVKAFENYY